MVMRHTQRQRRSAFTLMEMLVVVAIIVALAGIGGFFLMGQMRGSQESAAEAQVRGPLTQACQAFFIANGSYPDSLQQLLVKDQNGKGPYLDSEDALKDPWGQPYQYDKAGAKNMGTKPDIWTTSPVSGGTDQKMLGNWPKGR